MMAEKSKRQLPSLMFSGYYQETDECLDLTKLLIIFS